jgi:serine/threonine protein kinase
MSNSDDSTVRIPKKYKILEEIGRGRLTIVYKAFEPRLDRHLVVKVLRPQLTPDEQLVRRFLEGAREALKLGHPNIAQLYDVGEREDFYYAAMQYVEGHSLAGLVEQGALPLEKALDIVEQVAAALDYAHGQGFYHHYLTPRDVLVDQEGRAFVTDFGLKRAVAGMMPGIAPEYMAPEQVRGRVADQRADLYTLGVICYAMLGGRPPFQGELPAVLHAQVYEPPVPLRVLNPSLPPDVERVLEIALAKEPERRFVSGAEFARALRAAAERDRQDTEPRLKSVKPARPPRFALPTGGHLWLLAAIPAAFVGGICLVAMLWAFILLGGQLRRSGPPPVAAISPTATRIPTFMVEPSATSTWVPTPFPTPSFTPSPPPTPTDTPRPTYTLRPTFTPTPAIPLAVAPTAPFTLSNLTLARSINADGEPVSPGTVFEPGSEPVYAFFNYEGMQAGTHWAHTWQQGNVELDRAEGDWPAEWGDRGLAWVYYAPAGGFTPGDYEVRIWVGGKVIISKTFSVK